MSFPGRAVQRTWHLVDATSQTVGRLATTIAPILRGKHKPTFRPNGDCGDYVVVINADKVRLLFSSISFCAVTFLGITHNCQSLTVPCYIIFRFTSLVKNGMIKYIDGTQVTQEG